MRKGRSGRLPAGAPVSDHGRKERGVNPRPLASRVGLALIPKNSSEGERNEGCTMPLYRAEWAVSGCLGRDGALGLFSSKGCPAASACFLRASQAANVPSKVFKASG